MAACAALLRRQLKQRRSLLSARSGLRSLPCPAAALEGHPYTGGVPAYAAERPSAWRRVVQARDLARAGPQSGRVRACLGKHTPEVSKRRTNAASTHGTGPPTRAECACATQAGAKTTTTNNKGSTPAAYCRSQWTCGCAPPCRPQQHTLNGANRAIRGAGKVFARTCAASPPCRAPATAARVPTGPHTNTPRQSPSHQPALV